MDTPSPTLKVVGQRLPRVDARERVTAILDAMEMARPLPHDEEAMRLYSASDDPGRIEQARQRWRTRTAEREAMGPGSPLAALRNAAVRLEALP